MINRLTLLKVVILTFIACSTTVVATAQQASVQSTSISATDKEPNRVILKAVGCLIMYLYKGQTVVN
jgi:hypothetical protein